MDDRRTFLAMAAALGVDVFLNAPVRRIEQEDGVVRVGTEAGTLEARRVIVALSPPLAARIVYAPALPGGRDQLTQRMALAALRVNKLRTALLVGVAGGEGGEKDALYDQAVAIVLQDRKASISYVQRKLKIGYNRAARLLEDMEKAGLVSALTSDLPTMVAGRALQGVAMGAVPLGIGLIRDSLPREEAGSAMALVSSSMGIGGSLALPAAALVAQHAEGHQYQVEVAMAGETDGDAPVVCAAHPASALSRETAALLAEMVPALLEQGAPIDVVTDQTSAHDPLYYLPAGVAFEDWAELRSKDPAGLTEMAQASMARHVEAMVGFMDAGAEVFDYGNSIRDEARKGGFARAFDFPGFVPAYIRPLFCEGKGPFRWAALSGDPADIAATDRAILELFPDNEKLRRWITMAGERVHFQGLPARICWLGYGERARLGLRFNRMVREGILAAPVVIGRDHLDAGSVASPFRETEGMRDGSDAVADWPILNALLNASAGATWVSVHHGGGVGIGYSIHAGMVIVADGTKEASARLERVLTNDPGIGVARHADAGYEIARKVAKEKGVKIPMMGS